MPLVEAVLAVGLSSQDFGILNYVLAPLRWKLVSLPDLDSALQQVTSRPWAAVVCDRDRLGKEWRALLEPAGIVWPAPPLVVSSRLADESLWAEVLNLGGYDVLATPLRVAEVRRVVGSAAGFWHRRVAGICDLPHDCAGFTGLLSALPVVRNQAAGEIAVPV